MAYTLKYKMKYTIRIESKWPEENFGTTVAKITAIFVAEIAMVAFTSLVT